MFGIRRAIYDALTTDTALLAHLANGASSVINEGELRGDTALPCVVIHSSGLRAGRDPTTAMAVWEIRAHDKGHGYYNIDQILEHVVDLLDGASLDTTSSAYRVLEFTWDWETPAQYDILFRQQYKGVRFRVYLVTL